MPVFHPRKDDNGNLVRIGAPTLPSGPLTWTDPTAVAIFAPGSPTLAVLNGVSLRPVAAPLTQGDWLDWTAATGDEAEIFTRPGKKPSAGVVIVETDKRVWAFEPTNHFGGYTLTFPKGKAEAGWSLAATAAREAFEETGLLVEVGKFLADVERSTSIARFYLGRRRGDRPAIWVGRRSL